MASIFGIIATPLGYAMEFLYGFIRNYGLCIILLSVFVKLLTTPLMLKQKRSMLATQKLQPKIRAIQQKYATDRNRMNEEIQALYDREGASPSMGCGTILLTLVIMSGLYYVLLQPLTYFMHLSTDQITQIAQALSFDLSNARGQEIQLAGEIFKNFDLVSSISDKILKVNFNFCGIDLAATPSIKHFALNWIIPVLSGATAFFSAWIGNRISQRNNPDMPASTNAMMFILMPAMSVYFCFILPAGMGLYWIISNVFAAASEPILNKIIQKESEKK